MVEPLVWTIAKGVALGQLLLIGAAFVFYLAGAWLTNRPTKGASMKGQLRGVILFTAIELVTLVLWLILAGIPFSGKLGAVLVLAAGLFAEHFVSVNVGAGRRPFARLPW